MSVSTRTMKPLSVELKLRASKLDVRAQFRVAPGRVCALVGRPGSGKSGLLKAIAGLIPALGGRVALGADALYDSAARINLPAHQRRLAWLDGHGHLIPHLTVRQNLLFGARSGGRTSTHVGALAVAPDDIVNWHDLGAVLGRRPDQLPPAERFKLGLGRALLSSAEGLLLNDPLALVPEQEHDALLDLLAESAARFRLPMVLVSPRMHDVVRLADEVVILHEGRVASAGPTAQILSDVSLSTFLEGLHAGSVLEGEVKRHDIEWLLSEVDLGGQRVSVPAMLHPVGTKVRLKLRARDVSLHRDIPIDTSSSNHLRGRITQIMLAGEHGVYGAVGIELDRSVDPLNPQVLPGLPLWGLLTRKSIQQMGWAPGQPCVVGFKAMALTVSTWR